MTDDFLAELDALLAAGVAGRTDSLAAGMRAVTRRLGECEITGQQFLAADAGDTPCLKRHVLLCDNTPVSSPLNLPAEEVWRELSGSGRHYDGAFGLLPRDGKLTILGREVDFSQDQPAAPIGRQVALCLRVFNAPSIPRNMPELARAVQRHFNDILIAHQVLLHPGLLVPVQHNGTNAYMSVMHALASSCFGALPRVNHYPRLAPELLLPHLAKLARHPCLQRGLGVSWYVSFDVERGRMRRGRKSLVDHMVPVPSAKLRFLGSAMEMAELAQAAGTGSPLPLPLLGDPTDPDYQEDRTRVIDSLARSLFSACGIAHTDAAGPHGVEADLEFLEDVRKRRDTLLADAGFMAAVEKSMIRRLFSTRADDFSPTQVAKATDAIVNGLVEAGLKADLTESAQFVLESCIGRGRAFGADGNLPKAETATGIAFLQVIDSYGGFGSMVAESGGVSPARALLLRVHEVVRLYPAHQVPYRARWLAALDAFWAEKSMKHEILVARMRSTAAAAAGEGPAPAPRAAAVRRRHAI